MNHLVDSYAACRQIGIKSGSNFFRSFSLLRTDRCQAMHALYAFARLVDDAADGASSSLWLQSHEFDWHLWIESLANLENAADSNASCPPTLKSIRLALSDSVQRFSIPLACFHDIVEGVRIDVAPPVRFAEWEDTQNYCLKVASSIGRACLAIWSDPLGSEFSSQTLRAAQHCGIAFQLTNILRDIVEDAHRDRIYLPLADLKRYGISETHWCQMRYVSSAFGIRELGDWRGLIRVQIERALAHFDSGWNVVHDISLDSQRMFSMIWHTYRKILDVIQRRPESIWFKPIRLTKWTKVGMFVQHAITPLADRAIRFEDREHREVSEQPSSLAWPSGGPRVAVIGAGLAGISAAMHLSRHGCNVVLVESKNRMGGRVGSFCDPGSGQYVDYCQHVGMKCCSHFIQWLEDTEQRPFWSEQDCLHFVSATGKKRSVRALPLPAPFHLMSMLGGWPDLSWRERWNVARALRNLLTLPMHNENARRLTIDWLKEQKQSDRCVQNFWSTILVSALGEQLNRVTLGPTKKVIADGFAANRSAFHLMVPEKPLSTLFNEAVANTLKRLHVEVRLGSHVTSIQQNQNRWLLNTARTNSDSGSLSSLEKISSACEQGERESFDAVVIALPWNKVADVVPVNLNSNVKSELDSLESSAITGVHTWWDRPWFQGPHAILINRFCQWIFPGPLSNASSVSDKSEHYYQIVISGSRDLQSMDNESILQCVKADLSELFPEASVATLQRGIVVTDRNAVFSVSPDHFHARLRSDLLQSNQVWLAGDWTDTQWPATMEGAIRSGAIASSSLLSRFGRQSRFQVEDA